MIVCGCGYHTLEGKDVPYAPAGLICTVSFISPDRSAAMAFA